MGEERHLGKEKEVRKILYPIISTSLFKIETLEQNLIFYCMNIIFSLLLQHELALAVFARIRFCRLFLTTLITFSKEKVRFFNLCSK